MASSGIGVESMVTEYVHSEYIEDGNREIRKLYVTISGDCYNPPGRLEKLQGDMTSLRRITSVMWRHNISSGKTLQPEIIVEKR